MYIIEGNIGAGKSTFLKLIKSNLPHITVMLEPVESWQTNIYGQSLLANFYQDPHRWAYTMETVTMVGRVQEHLKEQYHPNPFRLMERSIYSGHYCFATNSYHNGFLSELEWKLYLAWFNFLVTEQCKVPHGFIYLKVDPEIAFERIKKRQREGESSISLDYLKQIHQCHETFLIDRVNVLSDLIETPVLILDCNEEFEQDSVMFKSHIEKTLEFMRLNIHVQRYHASVNSISMP